MANDKPKIVRVELLRPVHIYYHTGSVVDVTEEWVKQYEKEPIPMFKPAGDKQELLHIINPPQAGGKEVLLASSRLAGKK